MTITMVYMHWGLVILYLSTGMASEGVNDRSNEALAYRLNILLNKVNLLSEKVKDLNSAVPDDLRALDELLDKVAAIGQQVNALTTQYNNVEDTIVGFTAFTNDDHIYNNNSMIVQFPFTLTNLGGHYNPYSGIFMCPFTGYYMVTATLFSLGGGDSIRAQIMAGAEGRVKLYSYTRPDTSTQMAVVDCVAGEHVWVQTINNIGEIFQASGGRYSTFSGWLLHVI